MKTINYIFALWFLATACSKSLEARQKEKLINDTVWEFYYAEDAAGNDITAQVMQDSLICQRITFYGTDKDPVSFNALLEDCNNTYYSSYKGSWGVFDWKKIQSEYTPVWTTWRDYGLSVGNVGNENSQDYLIQIDFALSSDEDDVLISRRYKYEGVVPVEVLWETRYYRKVE